MIIQEGLFLKDWTSWQIGGPAEFFCLPETKEDLVQAVQWALQRKYPITVLGGGSNVLISDRGLRGLVICLAKFAQLKWFKEGQNLHIECFAGTGKNEILKVLLKHKNPAALFLAGLPGDAGGGVVMNAGVSEKIHPREFGDIVSSFEVLKAENGALAFKTFQHSDIEWSYRHSLNWQPGIISQVNIKVPWIEDSTLIARVREANLMRLSKQPLDLPSCGSVFINPSGYKAAQLIEQSGLKGRRMGDAQVSLKHANFIVNLGKASAQDTWALMLEVQKSVLEKTGVQLHTEVVKMGEFDS
jgi:UDP-N-acetylmuramate dehydrogenase